MAATTAVFTKLNPRQIELVAEQRQLNGAHAYYTETYDINRVPLLIDLPGHFNANSVLTIVYEYNRPYNRQEADGLTINISAVNDPRGNRVGVSGAYTFTYYWNNVKEYESNNENRISTPKQGLHVLQFRMDEQSLVTFLDGVQIAEKGKVVGRQKDLFRLNSGVLGKEPFVFWESHFTTPNPTDEFDRFKGFSHVNLKLKSGSYVQFSGSWTDKNKPKILDDKTVLGELDIIGDALLTISVYIDHLRITNGLDFNLGNVVPAKGELNLYKLHCNRPAQLDDITIVVGDYGR